jgi:hypothetical protein
MMTTATDILYILFNIFSSDSSATPSYVAIDDCTYTQLYCDCLSSIHHISQRPSGSLIDGVPNGVHSGSDVVAFAENFLTADVSGITIIKLQQVPVCTVAGLIQTQQGPITNMFPPWHWKDSSSCVILATFGQRSKLLQWFNNIIP